MATDAKFDKIQKILPHDNADTLEIAIVSNFPCVVRKGEFSVGDWCFYVRDDAKLIGYDEYKDRLERDKSASKTGDLVTQDIFSCSWPWQNGVLKYLGGGGRVKSIKLRGKVSMGILLKPTEVWPSEGFDDLQAELLNKEITNATTGVAYLEKVFGITHWVAPSTGMGALNVKFCGLPCSLGVTDQENWENLEEVDLHLGSECLITKKLDGTSTTVTCYPDRMYDGDLPHDISSRRMTFNVQEMEQKGEENVYTKFTTEAVKAGCWLAREMDTVVVLRGETCCRSVQNSSYNKDCQLDGFFVYSCEFPEMENYFEKHGIYGTDFHFLKIVEKMNSNGFNVKTVPVVGTDVVSKELLKKFNDMEWNWGEGVVLNIKCTDSQNIDSTVWSYKSKSREYLMKMK